MKYDNQRTLAARHSKSASCLPAYMSIHSILHVYTVDTIMGVDPRKNVEGTLPSLVCPPVPLEIVPLKSS